jgi:hypothetical protein
LISVHNRSHVTCIYYSLRDPNCLRWKILISFKISKRKLAKFVEKRIHCSLKLSWHFVRETIQCLHFVEKFVLHRFLFTKAFDIYIYTVYIIVFLFFLFGNLGEINYVCFIVPWCYRMKSKIKKKKPSLQWTLTP